MENSNLIADATSSISIDDEYQSLSDDYRNKIIPDYTVADLKHQLLLPNDLIINKEECISKLMEKIKKYGMHKYYLDLCKTFGWEVDQNFVDKVMEDSKVKLQKLNEKLDDAKSNYGDSEVRDAQLNIALLYTIQGDKEMSIEEFEDAYKKGISVGHKIDASLMLTRISLFHNDILSAKKYINLTKKELERAGDWERRNKGKVYEGLYLIASRKFNDATSLFLDCISTFTATEIISFDIFVFYFIILAVLNLDRMTLKNVVMVQSEVMRIISSDEALYSFLFSFYQCKYANFLHSLIDIAERIRRDRYIGKHYRYLIRNIRLRAYSQFLEPYKSVTLSSMAQAFDVSEHFIEEEVSMFITCGKLNCKIDRVSRVIESNKLDLRNTLYSDILKNGDMLLTRVQKLSRVIDM